MAVSLSNITSALATIFEDQLATQFQRSVVLSQLLPYKEGSTKQINWVPEFSGTDNSGAAVEGADVSAYSDDTVAPALLSFVDYSDAFAINGKALAAAQATGNPNELMDLFAEKLDRSLMRLARKLNGHIYNGDASATPPQLTGLLDTDGPLVASGTYAGLATATYSEWASNVDSNGAVARALSIQLMRDMRVDIFNRCGERPDLIICDASQQEKYGALLGPARRYVQDVHVRGMSVKLDGGYQSLDFDGIPVIADPQCPSGKMLFLNTRHLFLRQLPAPRLPMGLSSAVIRLHGTAEEQLGSAQSGFTARLNLLSVTGDAYKFQLILYPQVQCRRPNSCGVIADLIA